MYVGGWKDNVRRGHGTMTWADGYKCVERNISFGSISDYAPLRFVGEWKDGAEHGPGTETWANGTEWGTP